MVKKILVTGANGYIGHHAVKQLLDLGYQVMACDIHFSDIDKRAKLIEYNIFQLNSNNPFEDLGSPDICLHLAWRDGFIHNSNNHILDLSAHYKFLTALINGGLKHLAVMGTMHEVGYWEGKVDENTPCNPISLYGIAKDTLRKCLFQYNISHKCTLQWLRGYYILGDDLKNHSIFCKLLQAANDGKTIFPFTTGKIKYDFISVDELTYQIACVISQGEVSGIINCCSGHPVSLAEKVKEFIAAHKLNIKLDYGAYPDRPYDSPIIYGDTTKIKKILHSEKKRGR